MSRILLIDDNDSVRLVLRKMLEYLGHAVDEASSPEQARATFDPNLHPIVVTDNDIPARDDGLQLAREFTEAGAYCVIVSGRGEQLQNTGFRVLTKPVTLQQLSDELRPAA